MGRLGGSTAFKVIASAATVVGGALAAREINKKVRKAVQESKRQQQRLSTQIADLTTEKNHAEGRAAALLAEHHELRQQWQTESEVLVEGRFQSQRNVYALEQQLERNQAQMYAVHQDLTRAWEEAQNDAAQAQADIGVLLAQVARLEASLQDTQVAGHNMRNELQASWAQVQVKSEECRDQTILKESLQQANEELQLSRDSLQEVLNTAQAELQKTKEAKEEQTSRIDRMTLSHTQLQEQLTEAQADGSMVRQAKEQQSQKIVGLEGRIEELTRQAGVLTEAKEQATVKIVTLESSHTELQQLVETLEQQAVTVRGELDITKEAKEDLIQEAATLTAAKEQQTLRVSVLEGSQEELQQLVDTIEQQAVKDQGSLAELQQQHAGLQQHSQALKAVTHEQSQTIAGLNKLTGDQRDEIAALVRLDEEKSKRIAELETCNSELASQNLELIGESSELQASLKASQQAADQMELSLAERLGNLEAERDALRGSLAQGQAYFSAEEKARRQLEHDLAATKENFLLLASRHAELLSPDPSQDEALLSLRAEASSLTKQLADAEEAASAGRAALEKQLGRKIADLQESEARLASKSDVLEQEVLRLTERLSTYDGVHGDFERLQASMEDTQEQKRLLEGQLARAQQAAAQLAAQFAKSKDSKQAELNAMHAEMHSSAVKLQSAESKVEEVTQQLDAARAAVQQLEQTSTAATEQAVHAAVQQRLHDLQQEHGRTVTAHQQLQQEKDRIVTEHQRMEKSSRKVADAKAHEVQKLQKQARDTSQKLQAAESLSSDRLQKLSTAETALEESRREASTIRQQVAQLQHAAQEHNRLQLSSNRLAAEKSAALQQLQQQKTQLGKAQADLAKLKKTATNNAAERASTDRILQQLQHEHGQCAVAKAAMQAQHERDLAAARSQLAPLQQQQLAHVEVYRPDRVLQQPPPYLPHDVASGPVPQHIPAQHGQALSKGNSFAAVAGKPQAAYSPPGSIAVQHPQQTVPTAARNKSLHPSQNPGRVQQAYNISAGPAQLLSSSSGAVHFPVVGHPKLVRGYNQARARLAGEPEDLYEHEYITIAKHQGWTVVIPIRGDGDCGYRATAVGLVLALQAQPNAEDTSQAFLNRIKQLYGDIPEDMLSAQHAAQRAAQSSGSAYDGAMFFQELLLGMQGSSHAQICQRCRENPTGCDSLVLLFRALAASQLWRSPIAPFEVLLWSAFADDDDAVKPKNMGEYCYDLVLQRCYNGPQGNDRRFQQKACRQNELQHLSKALGVDFILGVKPGEGQDPERNGSIPIRPELNRRELAAMQCSWQGLTVRLVNHEAHYCLGIETNQV